MNEKKGIRLDQSTEHNFSLDTELSDATIRSIKREQKFRNEYVEMLNQHLASGYSLPSFAGIIKVNNATLYVWLKKYPAFKEVRDRYQKKRAKLYA